MNGDGCTGILVTHQDGSVECLDSDCTDEDMRRHDWRLACADLGEPCGACTPSKCAEYPAATAA